MLKIAIISGSARQGRQTPQVVHYVAEQFRANDSVEEVAVLDVAEYNFPVMEERRGKLENSPAGLDKFGTILEEADAIVFASPEYNGSYSGALKNALDYFYAEFTKKPIGVLTVSAGQFSGINASHDLQKLILNLGGYPIPTKLLIGGVHKAFDEQGNIQDERFQKSTTRFISELLWLTEALVNHKRKTA